MAAQIGTPYNGPMGPDQNRMSCGAHDSLRPPRAGTPPLTSLVSPCGPTGAAWDVRGWGLHDNGSASCEGQQKIGQ
jgi:hypothetical protein